MLSANNMIDLASPKRVILVEEAILTDVAARLEHEDRDARKAATQALSGQLNLPEVTLTAITARLKDNKGDARKAAVHTLGRQTVRRARPG